MENASLGLYRLVWLSAGSLFFLLSFSCIEARLKAIEPMQELPEKLEVQFGVHTSEVGNHGSPTFSFCVGDELGRSTSPLTLNSP